MEADFQRLTARPQLFRFGVVDGVEEMVVADMDDGARITGSPYLRAFAIDEQSLIDAVADAFEQRRFAQQDGELRGAALFGPHLRRGHLSLDPEA